ncbi:MBOAT family O-acyltransferase [Amedibacillus sp. YH-ame6]
MSFSSVEFIFMFLPIVLLLYICTPFKYKNVVLLISSLFFYAWGNVYHVCILFLLILLNFICAMYIEKEEGAIRKRRLLEAIILNVAILVYFKYYGFVLETVFAWIPQPPSYTLFEIPLGISFFTFSALAYLIDVYHNVVNAERNVITFALFISFFPKLIMGPIERFDIMKKQIEHHPLKVELFEQGCITFMFGLAQKLILANTMGSIWTMCYSSETLSMSTAWLGVLAFTFQIYFDFQGYTQMAIGVGKMFGFHLSQNFNYPYIATSVTDFWRRWHITLSSWFKDYIYIPLGGNRTFFEKALRNLMVVWLLTGIWHGANWTFILWGLYYGIVLIIEKYILDEKLEKLPTFLRWIMTMLVVMVGWIFFASNTIGEAFGYIGNLLMVRGNGFVDTNTITILSENFLYFVVAGIACSPLLNKVYVQMKLLLKEQMWYMKPILTACFFMILLAFLISNTYQAFLYFKF